MDALLTLAVVLAATALFVSEKLRVDVVALMVLCALLLLGLVEPKEALGGFSSEATITVAAMFVLSAGLTRSGALLGLGRLLARIRNPWIMLGVVLGVAAPVSAFINNTAAVAVFLPILLAAATAARRSPSRMLIPLSYVAQMGGVCTLIGTSTNLLVNSLAQQAGEPGFTLFEFSELGLVFLGFGVAYLLVASPFLLPEREAPSLPQAAELGKYVTELKVPEGSKLVGRTVAEIGAVENHRVYVLELIRGETLHWAPRATAIEAGDVLLVQGEWPRLTEFARAHGLSLDTPQAERTVLVEAMVAPNSRLAGRTLDEVALPQQHQARVIALHRRGERVAEQLRSLPLAAGDLVLLSIPDSEMAELRRDTALVIVSERNEERIDWRRALTAVGVMVAVVTLAALNIIPIVESAILGCIALVVLRALEPDEAYAAIDWRVIVLLAGVFPLGIAMQESGLARLVVDYTLGPLGGFGPLAALAALYLLTTLLTEVMSNNAAAVLLTPIALGTASTLGVDAKPFLIAVMFAASTAFATPVGYQTNTMVYSAGGYRFADFLRIGLPLNVLFFLVAIVFIPRYFPFSP
ncbi:SLC13 family permease [Silanimonas lenta]|uniref:SLC13 family permease n=1 Tax=Silanimonas lenta TaxID=265429 RepID=UPI000416433C|nr:SLC13 family permease [Silanimonas lenta]